MRASLYCACLDFCGLYVGHNHERRKSGSTDWDAVLEQARVSTVNLVSDDVGHWLYLANTMDRFVWRPQGGDSSYRYSYCINLSLTSVCWTSSVGSALNTALPTFVADAGGQQQTRRPPLLLSIDGTDGRTDGYPTVTWTLMRILSGPDLRGPRGPWPHAYHQQKVAHQTVHILFLANDRRLRDYDSVVAHCWSSF